MNANEYPPPFGQMNFNRAAACLRRRRRCSLNLNLDELFLSGLAQPLLPSKELPCCDAAIPAKHRDALPVAALFRDQAAPFHIRPAPSSLHTSTLRRRRRGLQDGVYVALTNAKRIYRLYREEGLQVRTAKRVKRAAHTRVPLPAPVRANQRWSMDFVSDRFADGKWLRILTVVDQFTRECLCAYADRSQTGEKVVEQMKRLVKLRGAPASITTDNGSEFAGQAMDAWAHQGGVKLDFIRPGRPVQNSYIESVNGRRRDECLNGEGPF